jgi:hypothetical protein
MERPSDLLSQRGKDEVKTSDLMTVEKAERRWEVVEVKRGGCG